MRARLFFVMLALAVATSRPGQAQSSGPEGFNAPGLTAIDAYTLKGDKSFLSGYEPINEDGTINVVVEIPTGTTAKWEVMKPSGQLEWEFKNGKPRIVQYLGYPGNYGMVPRTLLDAKEGGDGDPLDVIVLGPPVPRGSVVRAHLIGVLKLLDGGEKDDKLLAVLDGDALAAATSIDELDEKFPGVTTIVQIWFESYKGPGELESQGYEGPEAAMQLVKKTAAAYAR